MARSKRKTPIRGITRAESEKKDKQLAHRKYRRKMKAVLQQVPDAEILPHVRELSNPWSMSKDGAVEGYTTPGRRRFRRCPWHTSLSGALHGDGSCGLMRLTALVGRWPTDIPRAHGQRPRPLGWRVSRGPSAGDRVGTTVPAPSNCCLGSAAAAVPAEVASGC
jgi:hypothetical protein